MSQYLDKDGASRIAENFLSKQAEQDAILQNLQFDLKKAEHALVKTIQGPAPLNIKALTRPLEDYRISGNTVQDGTPAPDAPVDVVGCGARTANLFDKSTMTANAYLSGVDGQYLSSLEQSYSCIIKIEPRTSYRVRTASQTIRIAFFTQYPQPNDIPTAFYNHDTIGSYAPRAFIETSGNTDRYMVLFCYNSRREHAEGKTVDEIMSTVMISEGAEMSVSYEPYGYKLPITVNSTEYPIYLGQVPTTRRIKKMVLTGEEEWRAATASSGYRFSIGVNDGVQSDTTVGIKSRCSHFQIVGTGQTYGNVNSYTISADLSFVCRINSSYTLETFKQFLAAQYAAGNPVTVWYVLATPTTGIVNEPLHKIGDYADTISMAQAGVEISTTKGFNTITTDTTVLPSNIEVKGVINNA